VLYYILWRESWTINILVLLNLGDFSLYLNVCSVSPKRFLIPFVLTVKGKKIKGLNIFFVFIFVVFVTDGPHFYQMFKMIFIFTIRVLFDSFP